MAYSRINYVGNGSTTQFSINFPLGFLSRADVTCHVIGEVDGLGNHLYRTLTWINDGLVSISGAAPANGATVVFERTVDKDELVHDYSDGASIVEENLDQSNKQNIMLVHEVLDGRLGVLQNDIDFGQYTAKNLADPVDYQDAVNLQYFEANNALANLQGAVAAQQAAELAQAAAEDAEADAAAIKLLVDAELVAATSKADAAAQSAFDAAASAAYAAGAMVFSGTWNADTGVVTLKGSGTLAGIPAASTSNEGDYYIVSTGGATVVDGVHSWSANDWIVSLGTSWVKVDNTEPAASESLPGVAEVATQVETDTGTDDERFVTPLKLAGRTGVTAGKLVKLDAVGRLPPVDGSQLTNLPAVSVSTRQTVLIGASTSGAPSFLSSGMGLAVNLSATATPLMVTAANGFGTNGAVDTVSRITTDVTGAWSTLTASSTLFLYLDTTTPTAPTYGFSAMAPAYSYVAPSGPSTDQHWFDIGAMQMKRWNGAAWADIQRVFVGEAVTGASTVTSVVSYAFQGRYDSGLFAIGTSTTYSKSHNLGTLAVVDFLVSDDAAGTNERRMVGWHINGGIYGWAQGVTSRLSASAVTAANGWYNVTVSGTVTSGYGRIIAQRSF